MLSAGCGPDRSRAGSQRMSSDSSFPHPPDRRGQSAQPQAEPRGGRVLDFRSDEVSSPGTPVPAGTWASADDEPDAARSTERALVVRREREVAQVVAFPRQPSTQKRKRVVLAGGDAQSSARDSTPAVGAPAEQPEADELERPAYLASELLKQDWYPRTPLARSLRWGALGIGAIGALGALVFGGVAGGGIALASVLALCAIAGGVPIAAQVRGVAIGVLGVAGTSVAGWMRMTDGHEPAAPLLVACITLSASALFFRAAHRTSRLARTLVGIGLGATACWLLVTGGLDALVVQTLAWEDWIFPVSRLLLGLVIVAALLTFLDPTGHGGAWVAGGAFLGWLALDTAATVALALSPLHGEAAIDLAQPAWLATLAFPFLAVLTAGGLCQVWVLASRPPPGKREAPPTRATMA